MTKLVTLEILFSTVIRATVVAKLVILGISSLTLFILALREALEAKLAILGISPLTSFMVTLREALVAKLAISGILSSKFLILALHTSFLTTSNLFTLYFELFKLVGTFFNLSVSTYLR